MYRVTNTIILDRQTDTDRQAVAEKNKKRRYERSDPFMKKILNITGYKIDQYRLHHLCVTHMKIFHHNPLLHSITFQVFLNFKRNLFINNSDDRVKWHSHSGSAQF